jgi:Putative neutral zinc metallopeptidase
MLEDPLFWVFVLPGLLLGLYAQSRIKLNVAKYSQVPTQDGITGAEVARRLLDAQGLHDVAVESTPGVLSDHYDPHAKRLRLSQQVYYAPSVAAAGIAAHETGHGLQDAEDYFPMEARTYIVPVVQLASQAAPWLFVTGLVLQLDTLTWAGVSRRREGAGGCGLDLRSGSGFRRRCVVVLRVRPTLPRTPRCRSQVTFTRFVAEVDVVCTTVDEFAAPTTGFALEGVWCDSAGGSQMIRNSAVATAARLMSEFATRTGLSPAAEQPRRYLWTDAFAVCNFLELFERTSDRKYGRCATDLIEQVHRVLGRYRDDDKPSGWISGLDEQAGSRHPTAGGLRIGKPLKERGTDDAFDEKLEWDRDGQYFHYLTKWIHALCQAAFVTKDFVYALWAGELGKIAFERFVPRSGADRVVGVYWKMSTDLSRPLVPALGLHDALDGFITFREAQHALAKSPTNATATDLSSAIESLYALCQHGDWTTDDPLGLGGLLFDAGRLCQLISNKPLGDLRLLEEILDACRNGLRGFLAGRYLSRPLAHRLAFREFGLAIGLKALPIIAESIKTAMGPLENRTGLRRIVDQLLPYESLSDDIVSVWLAHAQPSDEIWEAHQDINDVMLATALLPAMLLSVGERVSSKAR